jgi:hypothetical protein
MVNVGVRAGSAVIMCSAFISTGSASAAVMWSVAPVYGFTAVSAPTARPNARVTALVRDGLPVR